MKKILMLMMSVCLISGCQQTPQVVIKDEEKPVVVCTIFPICDWVREIAQDKVEIVYLLDNGIDLHQYQPSAQDMIEIQQSDLVIYIGGDSDAWASSVINGDVHGLSLMSQLNSDDLIEFEHDHDHDGHDDYDHDDYDDHGHDDHDDHDHDDHEDCDHDDHEDCDHEYELIEDEHIWLSLDFAQELVEVITHELGHIDEVNKEFYHQQSEAYIQKLEELDEAYETMIDQSKHKLLVVADQFPLRYLASDYDLEYVAAFEGCSADSEVTFETMKHLTDSAASQDIEYLLTMENSQFKIADSIISNQSNLQKLSFDSMQIRGVENQKSYLDTMKDNLEVLRKALN